MSPIEARIIQVEGVKVCQQNEYRGTAALVHSVNRMIFLNLKDDIGCPVGMSLGPAQALSVWRCDA